MTPAPAPTASALVRSTLVGGLALLLLVALALAYLVGAGGRDDARAAVPVAAAAADDAAMLGTITMTGTGEVTAVPDQMTFRVAVTLTRPDVATAMDDASARMARVLDAIERAGVQRKDTESTGLSVDPQYRYPAYSSPVLVGYRVRQSASVLVRDLRDGGRAIAAAVGAGGNAARVSGIGLKIGDQDALLARARTAAVDDATAKAEQYAEATGQPLGRVLTVREGRLPGRMVRDRELSAQRAGLLASYDVRSAKAVPIRAGRTDVAIKVTVVWSLTD